MYDVVIITVISPTEKSRDFVCNVTSYNFSKPCVMVKCAVAETRAASSRAKTPLKAKVGEVRDLGQYS